jgi:hypothetical protein
MYTYTHTHCESVSHSLSGGAPEEEEDDHHHRHHHHSLVNDVSVYRQLREEKPTWPLSLLPIATPGHSTAQTAKEELPKLRPPPTKSTYNPLFFHIDGQRESLLYTATSAAAICPPLLRSTPAAYRRRSKLDDDDAPHLFLHSDATTLTNFYSATHLSSCCWLLIDIFPGRLYMPACFVLHPNFFFFFTLPFVFSRRYIFSFKLEWRKKERMAHMRHTGPPSISTISHTAMS